MSGPLVFKYAADATQVDATLAKVDQAHQGLAGKIAGSGAAIKNGLAPATSAFGALKGSLGALTGGFGPLDEGLEKGAQGVDHLKEVWSEMEGASQKVGAVMVAGGIAATGAGALMVEAGHAQETAQIQLEQAVKNTGHTFDDYKGKIDAVVKSGENHGVSMAKTDQALATLTTAFNDPGKAADAMSHVLDLAKTKNEDLSTATQQYIQIVEGKGTRVLTSMGIQVTALTTLQKDAENAQKAVTTATTAHQTAVQKLSDLQAQLASSTHMTTAEQIAMRDAQQHLTDVQAQLAGKTTLTAQESIQLRDAQQKVADVTAQVAAQSKLSLSQQDQLRNAQDAVAKTAGDVTAAKSKQQAAEEALTKAQTAGGSAIDLLNAKTKGMADAMDSTLGAKFAAAKVKVEDWVGTMGNKFGPELIKAGPLITGVGAVLESKLIPTLVTTGASFVGTGFLAIKTFGEMAAGAIADGATMVASITASAASWIAENAAMAAASAAAFVAENAATLGIGVAIVALVAGIVWVATHWKEVWGWIKTAASDAWSWIKQHVDLIVGLAAPFILPFVLLVQHWGEIWDSIKSIAGSAWDGIVSFVKGGINLVIGLIDDWIAATQRMVNDVLGVASHIPGLSSILPASVSIPLIPKLAEGGIVTSPTLALIGEAGPEKVIPLNRSDHEGQGRGFGILQILLDRKVLAEVTYDELLRTGRSNFRVGLA